MKMRLPQALVAVLAAAILAPASTHAAEALLPDGFEFPKPLPRSGPAVPVENLVHSIVLTPPTPNTVAFGSDVSISASYKTIEAGGVLISFRPMTGAKLTQNYAATPSALYSVGSGTATGSFSILEGNGKTRVTRIRCQMWNAAQTTLLYEAFIPVNFKIR